MQELLKTIPSVKTIKTALNGSSALEIIGNSLKPPFNVIFLDIHMPILDGPNTIKILKERESKGLIDLSKTRIVALSAVSGN
jgi:CheY-like chemotaxis protein